jgi:hypothetical protein
MAFDKIGTDNRIFLSDNSTRSFDPLKGNY